MTQTQQDGIPRNGLPIISWGAIVIAALALGFYAEAPRMPKGIGPVFPRVPGPPQSLPILLYMLGVGSVVWYAVVVGFPLVLWGARHVESEKHGIGRSVGIAVVVLIVGVAMTTLADYLLTYPAIYRPPFNAFLSDGIRKAVLPWTALIAIVAAIEGRRRAVQSRVERERLRAEIAEQRLVALTGQLQPHFLFNTLQGISTLIHRDPDSADEMLSKLSDLLRDLLRHRDSALVRLSDEMKYTRTYLEIAHLRFADRLAFTIDAHPDVLGAAVPLFVLQPLVENAIGHGIGGKATGGTITVRANRSGNRLMLEVEDDGVGLTAAPGEGVGLGNTRERLRVCFGSDADLNLRLGEKGGTIATIVTPFKAFSASVQS
ncbi:MAG: histidine kinase [Gemmatimonadales bacterium]